MSTGINLRLLWTWDHATKWSAARPGGNDWGASNEYNRSAEDFVVEYSRLLHWCGQNGIEGVVVWGLLRDNHGGVEAACRLCDIARETGVKLLAGIGLNAYGGAYYEGDSPWSLNNHLRAHPELYALGDDGRPLIRTIPGNCAQPFHHACPSRPQNQDYCQESLRWLMAQVPLDGVQVEAGDTGVCQCPLCDERRQHGVSIMSWEDMALMYPLAAEAAWAVRPEATVVLETYSHPGPVAGEPVPSFGEGTPPWAAGCLDQFPRGAHVQWVCDGYIPPHSRHEWTAAGQAPPGFAGNIMRAHVGTWWGRYGDELAVDWLAVMARQSLDHGFDGLSIFGEKLPFHTGCELNYLALADYGSTTNPTADLNAFLDRVAAPLLGGSDLAREYLQLARAMDEPERLEAAAATARGRAAVLGGRPAERWGWLAWYLSRFSYDRHES